ncbi:hypothetical protein ACIA8K_04025 [Catenuloplanes sp. NPDC051500]|uniref:hypothetical protein n=1 Tax=Catenuloplanes sp. NPDC051500 TaxID=3363959 RepID=UPI0037B5C13D
MANPLASLCPDGRLIPTGNGVLFHPYSMEVPVDQLALVRAMQAPREKGPVFFLTHEALADPSALGTTERVVSDLLTGQQARIATAAGKGTEGTAIGTWLTAADAVGVPISVPYQSWMDLSPRVIRVDATGRPTASGEFVRVLPKGLTLMRAALGTAAGLATDTGRTPWQRLQELVASIAVQRESLQVPRAGTLAGAKRWQAGFQLAAGIALGLPGVIARDPLTVPELLRLWGDPAPAATVDPESLVARLLARPGQVALVHRRASAATGPESVLWLVAHDGGLRWVDLSAADGAAIREFDPSNPLDAAALAATGTSVHLLDPASVARPKPVDQPDMSDWQPVGSPTATDLLREQFPQLAGLNQDRTPDFDMDWLTNCVIASVAAVTQMLNPGTQHRSMPMPLTDVDLLASVVDNGETRDTDRMETIARSLPVVGATGFVIVGAEPGRPSHILVARRVAPALAGVPDVFDGIAFYDAQMHAQAKAPVDPVRLRFVGITGTGVDTAQMDKAPTRTPAAVRRGLFFDGQSVRDVAGVTHSAPTGDRADRFARLAADATDLLTRPAVTALPAGTAPLAGSSTTSDLTSLLRSFTVENGKKDVLERAARDAGTALNTAWAAVDAADVTVTDAQAAVRTIARELADADIEELRQQGLLQLAQLDASPEGVAKQAEVAGELREARQEKADVIVRQTAAGTALTAAQNVHAAAITQAVQADSAFRKATADLADSRDALADLRVLIDGAQEWPAVASGTTTARAVSAGTEGRQILSEIAAHRTAATNRALGRRAQVTAVQALATAAAQAGAAVSAAEATVATRQRAHADAVGRVQTAMPDFFDKVSQSMSADKARDDAKTALGRAKAALDAADAADKLAGEQLVTAKAALADALQAHRARPETVSAPSNAGVTALEKRIQAYAADRPRLQLAVTSAERALATAMEAATNAKNVARAADVAGQALEAAAETAEEAVKEAETALAAALTALRTHQPTGVLEQRLHATGRSLSDARAQEHVAQRQFGDARSQQTALETAIRNLPDLTHFGNRRGDGGKSAHSYLAVGSEVSMSAADAVKVRNMLYDRLPSDLTWVQRDRIKDELARIATTMKLVGILPSAVGLSGSVHVVGTGKHAKRLYLTAEMIRHDEPDVLPDYPTPAMNQSENRKYHASSNTSGQQTANLRDMRFSTQPFIPLDWGPFRVLNFAGTARVTHNKYTRTTNTELGAGQGTVERLRGPGHGHSYTVRWSARYESASTPVPDPTATPTAAVPPADAERDAGGNQPVSTRVTVNFPEHMAAPQPPASQTWPTDARLDELPMSLDTFHDPAGIGLRILGVLPRLAGIPGLVLDAESQREVMEFSGFGNTHSALPPLRRKDGLRSNTLKDADGTVIGTLRLRAKPKGGGTGEIVTQSTFNALEFYHQIRLQERGTARVRNAAELGVNLGLTGIMSPIEETTVAGTYGSVSGSLTGAVGHGVGSGTNTSANSEMGRGLRSGKDADATWKGGIARAMVADMDTDFHVDLIRPDGTVRTDSWTGEADKQQGARARWLPYTLKDADKNLHMTAGLLDGDAPGLVIYENLTLGTPTWTRPAATDTTTATTTGGSRTMPGAFDPNEDIAPLPRDLETGESGPAPRTGEDAGTVAARPAPEDMDTWVERKLRTGGFLTSKGAGDTKQGLNQRRLLDTASDFYREAMADELRGDGIWVPYEREAKTGIERVWVRYFARPVDGAAPTYHGSTDELRLNTSVDSFFRNDMVRSHFTTKRGGANVTGNIPLKASAIPDIPKGLKPEQVADFIKEHAPTHSFNTVPITVMPIGQAAENSVVSTNGQVVSRSVILSSSSGQPVHKWTMDQRLDAEIYDEGAMKARTSYSNDVGAVQPATMDVWASDMRVTATAQTRAAIGTPRDATPQDRERLMYGPALPNLSGVVGVRGSTQLKAAFRGWTNKIFKSIFQKDFFKDTRLENLRADSLLGKNPASDATVSAQARRVFLSQARMIATIDAVMRSSESTEQPFEDGALSVPEGRHELQGYVASPPRLIPPRPGAQTKTYVEDGSQAFGITEIGEQHATDRTHNFGAGLTMPYGNIGGQFGFGRGHREQESDTLTGIDYRINNYELPVHTIAVPVTFVGTSVFAARNIMSGVQAAFTSASKTEAFALDVPDAIESMASVNDLATIWQSLEMTWPHDTTRPIDTGRLDGNGNAVGPEFITGLPDALLNDVMNAKRILFHAPDAAPPAGEDIYYPPRRISGRQGLGDASILDVHLDWLTPSATPAPTTGTPATATATGTGTAAAAPAPIRTRTRGLFDDAIAAVNRKMPGVMDPGSTVYKAGLYSDVGKLASSLGLRTAVRRYFSAGNTNQPVRLGRVSQVVAGPVGQWVIEVETIARPAERYRSGTGDPTELYGTTSEGADLEMHGMSGRAKQYGRDKGKSNWAFKGAGVLHDRPSQTDRLRLAGAAVEIDILRQHNQGDQFKEQQTHRFITKSSGNMARAHMPIEIGVRVSMTPYSEWVPTRLTSTLSSTVSDSYTAGSRWLGFADPPPQDVTWHKGHVALEFMKKDASRDPLTRDAPPGQNRPVTIFQADAAAPGQVTRLPDADQLARETTRQRHFTNAEVRSWEPFGGLKERFRVSRFGAAHLMADAVSLVLPSAHPAEVQDFVDNEVGGGNTYELMSDGGVDHTLLNYTAGLAHDLDLEIKPVRASAWRKPVDTYVDSAGTEHQFTPGEIASAKALGSAVFEYFPIVGTSTTVTASTGQIYGLSVAPVLSWNLGEPTQKIDEESMVRRQVAAPPSNPSGGGYYNIRPEYGAAPGNQQFMNTTLPGIRLQGGQKVSSASGVAHVDRRGQRLAADAGAGTDQATLPYVLRERDVLFEVTGKTPRAFSELADTLALAGRWVGESTSEGLISKLSPSANLATRAGEKINEKFTAAAKLLGGSSDNKVVRTRYVATTVQVRIPLAELQPGRDIQAGEHLGSDRTNANDNTVAGTLAAHNGWTMLIGEARTISGGPLVGGRTTDLIVRELDAIRPPAGTGVPAVPAGPANVTLIGGDHGEAGLRLSKETGGWVLAQTTQPSRALSFTDPIEAQQHRYQRAVSAPSGWVLYHNGTYQDGFRAPSLANAVAHAEGVKAGPPATADVAGSHPEAWKLFGQSRPVDLIGGRKPSPDALTDTLTDWLAEKQPPVTTPVARPAAPAPDPLTLPGRDREIRMLGDFSTPAAVKALAQITAGVRGSAGGPVVAIDLGGTTEAGLKVVRQLDEMLRHDAWLGESPILAATMGTNGVLDAFAEVRLARNVVTVLQGMAKFDQVWQVYEPGGANPWRLYEAPDANLFRRAGELTPVVGHTLARPLAEWLRHTDWAAAEAYQRANDLPLRTPEVLSELRDVVAGETGDLRLQGFLTALSVADRAGGFPAEAAPRLVPAATSFLDAEPAYDPARGPMPATFVYDYLRSSGGTRRQRFALDGVLFQLMVAGQLTHAETAALVRATAADKLDRANAKVFEMVMDLTEVSAERLLTDSDAVLNEFLARAGRVASTLTGVLPEDCLDPIDRTAWVARLDFLRDRWRDHGDQLGRLRAQILDSITYTLSNC